MAGWQHMDEELWRALAGLDTAPYCAETQREFRLALVGTSGSGKTSLASLLAGNEPGELSSDVRTHLPEYRLPLSPEDVGALGGATLMLLVLDATKGQYLEEVAAADYLSYLGRPVLVCYNKIDLLPPEAQRIRRQARWRGAEVMQVSAVKGTSVQDALVPALLQALPGHALSMARCLPMLRSTVRDGLVSDAAMANAAYAAATGLARPIPTLGVPFSLEEARAIAGRQAAMVYSLGLAHGMAPDWHGHAEGLRSSVDVAELWQRIARECVGLFPRWGLDSKVRSAYVATELLGRLVGLWCNTGGGASAEMLRAACRESMVRAREVSRDVVGKARGALPARRPPKAGVVGNSAGRAGRGRLAVGLLGRRRARVRQTACGSCGHRNPSSAVRCGSCGATLRAEE